MYLQQHDLITSMHLGQSLLLLPQLKILPSLFGPAYSVHIKLSLDVAVLNQIDDVLQLPMPKVATKLGTFKHKNAQTKFQNNQIGGTNIMFEGLDPHPVVLSLVELPSEMIGRSRP